MSMYGDWIQMTCTTSGTGAITPSAVTGYSQLSDQFMNPSVVKYSLVDGNNRESGFGVWNGTTLTRTYVTETLVSGTFTYVTAANAATAQITLSGGTTTLFVDFSVDSDEMPGIVGATDSTKGVPFIGLNNDTATSSYWTLTQGYGFYVPFTLPISGWFSGIRHHFKGTPAGTFDCAIYSTYIDGSPYRKLAAIAAATAISGFSDTTINFTSNVFLKRKVAYWWAGLSQGGACNLMGSGNQTTVQMPSTIGLLTNGTKCSNAHTTSGSQTSLPDPATALASLTFEASSTNYRPVFSLIQV